MYWIAIVGVMIFFFSKSTHSFLSNYLNSAVMIKHEGTLDELEKIVFPAITFNNELQINSTVLSAIVLLTETETPVEDIIRSLGNDL
jgi:hypothetical protein